MQIQNYIYLTMENIYITRYKFIVAEAKTLTYKKGILAGKNKLHLITL